MLPWKSIKFVCCMLWAMDNHPAIAFFVGADCPNMLIVFREVFAICGSRGIHQFQEAKSLMGEKNPWKSSF